jgi:hypothetical protein
MSVWSSIAIVHIVSCALVVERALLQTCRCNKPILFKSELIVIAVAPKGNSQKDKTIRKGITIKIKQEIVEKSENGSKANVLAKEYGLSQSAISTSLLNKDKMEATKESDSPTRMIKGREGIVEMERLLLH